MLGKPIRLLFAALAIGLAAPAAAEAGFLLNVGHGGATHTFNIEAMANGSSGANAGGTVSWSGFHKGTAGGIEYFVFEDLRVGGYQLYNGRFELRESLSSVSGASTEGGALVLTALEVERRAGSSAADLNLRLAATDYAQPQGLARLHSTMTGQFASSLGNIDLNSYVTPVSANPFNVSGAMAHTSASGHNVNADRYSGQFNLTDNYSMVNTITLSGMGTGTGNRLVLGQVYSQVETIPTPAPPTAVLAGIGVLGLAGIGRLRRKAAPVA